MLNNQNILLPMTPKATKDFSNNFSFLEDNMNLVYFFTLGRKWSLRKQNDSTKSTDPSNKSFYFNCKEEISFQILSASKAFSSRFWNSSYISATVKWKVSSISYSSFVSSEALAVSLESIRWTVSKTHHCNFELLASSVRHNSKLVSVAHHTELFIYWFI